MPVNAFPKNIYTNDSRISYYQPLVLDDGTWTLLDSTNFIQSVSSSASGSVISVNALGVANNQLQIQGIGSVSVAPRWYKGAYYDDGTPVLGTDVFILTVSFEMKGSTAGALRYFNWGFGVCADPTSTAVGTIAHNVVGNGWNFANTDADTFGVYFTGAGFNNTSPLNTNDTIGFGNISLIGGHGTLGLATVNASDVHESDVAAGMLSTDYTSSQLYTYFVCGARGTGRTFSAGDATLINLKYKFSKIDKVSANI
tara:strand:- start:2610 stop:3374 length:765 start_codon:yes stop_codon:yes gene_type:complete